MVRVVAPPAIPWVLGTPICPRGQHGRRFRDAAAHVAGSASPGATLASGVSSGFITGLLIGGVGGRLAMFLLRLTSDPALRGRQTDDGFTIGVFSTETLFLLGVTAGLGVSAACST